MKRLLCAVCLAMPTCLVAQSQCTDDLETQLVSCVDASVQSCLSAAPGCSAQDVRTAEVRKAAEKKCFYKIDGQTRRPGPACRACITALMNDLRLGSSRILFPLFIVDVNAALRDLRDECATDSNPEASPSPGQEGKPDERFCERFPRAPRCQNSASGES